jgi:hypothetical protein
VPEPAVAATATPSDSSPDRLWLRPDAHGSVSVDRGRAGCGYLSFQAAILRGGEVREAWTSMQAEPRLPLVGA